MVDLVDLSGRPEASLSKSRFTQDRMLRTSIAALGLTVWARVRDSQHPYRHIFALHLSIADLPITDGHGTGPSTGLASGLPVGNPRIIPWGLDEERLQSAFLSFPIHLERGEAATGSTGFSPPVSVLHLPTFSRAKAERQRTTEPAASLLTT